MQTTRFINGHYYTWWPDWFDGVWARSATENRDDLACNLILKTTDGNTIQIRQSKKTSDGYAAP